jgi:hypothetical protein
MSHANRPKNPHFFLGISNLPDILAERGHDRYGYIQLVRQDKCNKTYFTHLQNSTRPVPCTFFPSRHPVNPFGSHEITLRTEGDCTGLTKARRCPVSIFFDLRDRLMISSCPGSRWQHHLWCSSSIFSDINY